MVDDILESVYLEKTGRLPVGATERQLDSEIDGIPSRGQAETNPVDDMIDRVYRFKSAKGKIAELKRYGMPERTEDVSAQDIGLKFRSGLDRFGELLGRAISTAGRATDFGSFQTDFGIIENAGKAIEDYYKKRREAATAGLSKAYLDEERKKYLEFDENGTLQFGEAWSSVPKILGSLAESGPSTAVGMAGGYGIAKLLISRGMTAGMAAAIGGKISPEGLAGVIGGAAGEGGMAGVEAAKSAYDLVIDAPLEIIANDEGFRAAYYNTPDDLPEDKRIELARRSVARKVAAETGLSVGLFTAVAGAPSGYALGKIIGGTPNTRIGAALIEGLLEPFQEGPQSSFEKYIDNLDRQRFVDPTIDVKEGVAEAGVEGAVTGAAMGFALGGATHSNEASKGGKAKEDILQTLKDEIANNTLTVDDAFTLLKSDTFQSLGITRGDIENLIIEAQANRFDTGEDIGITDEDIGITDEEARKQEEAALAYNRRKNRAALVGQDMGGPESEFDKIVEIVLAAKRNAEKADKRAAELQNSRTVEDQVFDALAAESERVSELKSAEQENLDFDEMVDAMYDRGGLSGATVSVPAEAGEKGLVPESTGTTTDIAGGAEDGLTAGIRNVSELPRKFAGELKKKKQIEEAYRQNRLADTGEKFERPRVIGHINTGIETKSEEPVQVAEQPQAEQPQAEKGGGGGEIIAVEKDKNGDTYEYRVGRRKDKSAPQLKYEIQMRRVGSKGWEPALFGGFINKELFPERFVQRFGGDVATLDIKNDRLQDAFDKHLAEKEKDARAEKERIKKRQKEHLAGVEYRSIVSGVKIKGKKGAVEITINNGTKKKIDATIYGDFAITKGDKGYSVTHIGSGFSLVKGQTLTNARNVIRALQLHGISGSVEDIRKNNQAPEAIAATLDYSAPTDELLESARKAAAEKGNEKLSVGKEEPTAPELPAISPDKKAELARDIRSWLSDILPDDVLENIITDVTESVESDAEKAARSIREHKELGNTGATIGKTVFRREPIVAAITIAFREKGTARSTTYHEAFHVVLEWLLPEKDYQKIMRHYGGNAERAANAFAAWASAKKEAHGKGGANKGLTLTIIRIFKKLKSILAAIRNGFAGKGFSNPEAIFENIWGKKYTAHFGGTVSATGRGGIESLSIGAEKDGRTEEERQGETDRLGGEPDALGIEKSLQAIIGNKDDFDSESAAKIIDSAKAKTRPALLGSLTRRMLADMYRRFVPSIDKYKDSADAMDAFKNRLMRSSDKLHRRWRKLDFPIIRQLSEIMHRATVSRVHPNGEFESILAGNEHKKIASLEKAKQELEKKIRAGASPAMFRNIKEKERQIKELKGKIVDKKKRWLGIQARILDGKATDKQKQFAERLAAEIERLAKRAEKAEEIMISLSKSFAAGNGLTEKQAKFYAGIDGRIEKLRGKIAQDSLRKKEHEKLKALFLLLPKEARDIYHDVKKMYAERFNELFDAISIYIKNSMTGSARTAALYSLRKEFEKQIGIGPFFPLFRTGDHIIIAKKMEDGVEIDRIVRSFESEHSAIDFARTLVAEEGFTPENITLKLKKEYNYETDGPANKFAEKITNDINEKTKKGLITEAQRSELLDDINQAIIAAMPDLSHRKHFAHRKAVKGYSEDALRAFAHSMFHGANHIARIRFRADIQNALEGMQNEVEKFDRQTVPQQVVNEMKKRHKILMNPNVHPLAQLATSAGFMWNIGPSIASSMVNLSQTPLVAYSHLGARYGFDKAAVAIMKATKDFILSKWSWESGFNLVDNKKITKDERRLIKELIEDGPIEVTLPHELATASSTDYLSLAGRQGTHRFLKVMQIISWPFHVAEVANRQITALAAYRLERDGGKSSDFAKRKYIAKEAVLNTHFDYGSGNRARLMQGNVARAILLFKTYSLEMTYLLGRTAAHAANLTKADAETRRIARRQLGAMIAGHSLVVGAMGMPVLGSVGAMMEILANAFGDDDKPWDWEADFRNMLADTLGKDVGEYVAKGPIRAILPWDVSARLSLGDLWFRGPSRELEGRAAFSAYLEAILGPLASNMSNIAAGVQAISEGQKMRGVEMMLPKALKDVLKTIRYSREGVRSWRGVTLIDELKTMELVGQVIGFAPVRSNEMYEGKSAVKKLQHRLERRRSILMNDYIRAWRKEDASGKEKAWKKIRKFSEENPEFGISGSSLIRAMRKGKEVAGRTRNGIYLPRTKRGLREQGRFANMQ